MISKKFPQYLSKPFQVLWFEVDELVLFLFFLTLSLIYGKLMWVVFLVSQYSYTKTKRSQARGFLKHLLYVFGMVKMKNYPDYFQQEFGE
ncbi:MAG: type IV conjugative transfer system protein TraL [Desulfobulbaceae bacterium]|nr:type IV conjugative transfer system protein TraL [Desulfobulbaceae bacterium]